MKFLKKFNFGALYISMAGILWAFDALFRADLVQIVPTSGIVFTEHVIGFLFLSPIFFRSIQKYRSLDSIDWLLAILVSLISGVGATYMFTKAISLSFDEMNFVIPVLLIKLRPIFIIIFAKMILHERISFKLFFMMLIAFGASYLVTFGADIIDFELSDLNLIFLLSLGASICWALGAILSKRLLRKLSYAEATSLRSLASIPISFMLMLILNEQYSPKLMEVDELIRFLGIAIFSGFFGLLLYYKGLKKTPAFLASLADLTFPIATIVISILFVNPYLLVDVLDDFQVVGILILIPSILCISLLARENINDQEKI